MTKSLHEKFARRYPTRAFDGGGGGSPLGPPASWHAGDSYDPGILGWLLTIAINAGDTALIQGHLRLRFPQKDTVAYDVEGFSLSRGGVVFVPWPFIDLQIGDANAANANDSTATVSFWPVFRSDPFPSGVSSVLFGRSQGATAGGPPALVRLEVPPGATEYRVMPAEDVPNILTVRERGAGTAATPGSGTTFASYRINAVTASSVVPGTETGAAAWRETPPQPRAEIEVESGAAGDDVTVFWRYDLGALR